MQITDFHKLERVFLELSEKAGAAIMQFARTRALSTRIKPDQSPVTAADLAADKIICEGLAQAFPNIPILSEERVEDFSMTNIKAGDFFVVDPLDGTKEFINQTAEFTVNIALIRQGWPICGVVDAPALGHRFFTNAQGKAMEIPPSDPHQTPRPLKITAPPDMSNLRVITSRSHPNPESNAYLARYRVGTQKTVGSSLKFCLLAAGKADLYPRFAPTMEWDSAAGQAVLEAANGAIIDAQTGNRLGYGKPGFKNPSFIAHSAGVELR